MQGPWRGACAPRRAQSPELEAGTRLAPGARAASHERELRRLGESSRVLAAAQTYGWSRAQTRVPSARAARGESVPLPVLRDAVAQHGSQRRGHGAPAVERSAPPLENSCAVSSRPCSTHCSPLPFPLASP
jgi:hypothetical protein